MEYSPPPLFKQGASARAKVVFFSLIAIGLLLADSRMQSLAVIRQAVGAALYPLQMAALAPRDLAYDIGDYFTSLSSVKRENAALLRQQAVDAQLLQQAQQLLAENAQLRKLLDIGARLPVKALMSEILYDARDPFTRKIVVDRGSQNGVELGQPVIDDVGVVGQVTRIYPFTSEVTLLTDKDQAIPVQVVRSGLRSVAYGRGESGVLDLRFMATNADIQKGDVLVTSGIDGVYPPGLAVARVSLVENKSNDAFAHISCQPAAGIDRNRQLMILLVDARPPRPAPEENRDRKDKPGRHGTTEGEAATTTAAAGGAAGSPANAAATPATAAAQTPRTNAAAAVPAVAKPIPLAPAAPATPTQPVAVKDVAGKIAPK
ncbi:MAG: rod shape-determining protein MreC [Burkholderiaceae bacterium]|nr:rod shape-determining protein MreC [Burkholderiaceae bacterium]